MSGDGAISRLIRAMHGGRPGSGERRAVPVGTANEAEALRGRERDRTPECGRADFTWAEQRLDAERNGVRPGSRLRAGAGPNVSACYALPPRSCCTWERREPD